MELTQEWLKEHTEFSKEKRTLVWKKVPSNRAVIGNVIGSLSKEGYYRTSGKLVHRLVWLYYTGTMPENDLDHINGLRTDNRIENLRETTRGLNTQNRKETLGYTFVPGRSKPWLAQIKVNYQNKNLGYFKTKEEARNAYLKAKKELHSFFVSPEEV
jgi:hypothetical protein